MFSDPEDLSVDDFNRVPKKHKHMRKDGDFISQALVDKVRTCLFQGKKDSKVERYGVCLPDDIITYASIKKIVGEEASKILKCLLDEGLVEKIKYPRDKPAIIEVDGRLTNIHFKDGKWKPVINDGYGEGSIWWPSKVHKALRKYYKRGWGDRWRLRSSTLSKKAKEQLFKDVERNAPIIDWDEVGYRLIEGEAYNSHGLRLGFLEKPKNDNCPHCGVELPFKGRHGIYSRGHSIEECRKLTVQKVFNE